MNPWKIIGWLVLAAIVWAVAKPFWAGYTGYNSRRDMAESRHMAPPSVTFRVDGIECRNERGWFKGKVTVQNMGPGEVSFAKLFLESGDYRIDTYFQPPTIPEGAMASASWMERGETTQNCSIQAIQDNFGKRIVLSN